MNTPHRGGRLFLRVRIHLLRGPASALHPDATASASTSPTLSIISRIHLTVTARITVTGPVCSDSEDSISIDYIYYGSNWDEYCGPAVGFAKYSAVKLRDHW